MEIPPRIFCLCTFILYFLSNVLNGFAVILIHESVEEILLVKKNLDSTPQPLLNFKEQMVGILHLHVSKENAYKVYVFLNVLSKLKDTPR
jgi:hypothetical protein